MASALQELRKAAGYKTAKEFASAMDIPLATYSRYESNPEKIPLAAAWSLADKLEVTIDVVVGRDQTPVKGLQGDVQRAYEELSCELKASLDDYLEFLTLKNKNEKKRSAAREKRNYEVICTRLERLFLFKLDAEESDLLELGTGEQMREAFRRFLEKRSDEKQEPEAKNSVDKIMEAYDRLHCACVDAPSDFSYNYVDFEGGVPSVDGGFLESLFARRS